VKPFRGKPEKPERSKGEIHSRFAVGVRRTCDGRRFVRFPLLPFFEPIANACTFLLVGRRDPLGVGLRLAVEPVRYGSPLRTDPRVPADSLDGIRKV
jgi:hypothetical protein